MPILLGWKVAFTELIFMMALGSRAWRQDMQKKCAQNIKKFPEKRFFSSGGELAIQKERKTVKMLTSCLLKYFRTPSRSDRINFRLRYCPLSRPRFHRNPSL